MKKGADGWKVSKPPEKVSEDEWDECYECRGLGDDYSLDESGELVSNCDDCPLNPVSLEEMRYAAMDWGEDESEEDEDD